MKKTSSTEFNFSGELASRVNGRRSIPADLQMPFVGLFDYLADGDFAKAAKMAQRIYTVAAGKALGMEPAPLAVDLVFGSDFQVEQMAMFVTGKLGGRWPQMRGGRGCKQVSTVRRIGMAVCRTIGRFNLDAVGLAFGDRDHATVLYAVRTVEQRCQWDHEFRLNYEYACRMASLWLAAANGKPELAAA